MIKRYLALHSIRQGIEVFSITDTPSSMRVISRQDFKEACLKCVRALFEGSIKGDTQGIMSRLERELFGEEK